MEKTEKSFTFEVDHESSVPTWSQLRKRIVQLIETGYFQPGDQLPKIRELAADIAINFNTVNKAYLSLQSDGYLKSVRGKGVFVTDAARFREDAEGDELTALLDDCLRACRDLGATYEEAAHLMMQRARALGMAEAKPQRTPGSNVIKLTSSASDAAKEA